jgi:hypothetical protein
MRKQRSRIEHREKVSTKDYRTVRSDNQEPYGYIIEKYAKSPKITTPAYAKQN